MELVEDPSFTNAIQAGTACAYYEDDHTVRVDPVGLRPGTRYFYRFNAEGETSVIGRPFEPLHECKTLEDYRMHYNRYHRDPDVQAIHSSLPIIATVDDQEFADGAWRGDAVDGVAQA